MFGQEDKPEIAVLASDDGALDLCHVCRQELVILLGGCVVGFPHILVEGGGCKPLKNGIDQYGGQNDFSADF